VFPATLVSIETTSTPVASCRRSLLGGRLTRETLNGITGRMAERRMRTLREAITSRWAAGFLGLCVAAGLYALGRVTADSGEPSRTSVAYARGQQAGRAEGIQEGLAQGRLEGRAYQETRALPPTSRVRTRMAFGDGYRAGANDVFSGYDGGWSYDTPYLITLGNGGSGSGITYRLTSRTPVHAGVNYYLCPHSLRLCQEPRR
jgi:hypothetical protein